MSYPELKMLIAGDWVVGGAGKSEPVFCPADGSEIGQVPHATTSDLDRALESSLEGFNIWRKMTPHSRQAVLEKAGLPTHEIADCSPNAKFIPLDATWEACYITSKTKLEMVVCT